MNKIFIGRNKEVNYLRKAVKKGLILLLGPRGIGKSTLLRYLYERGYIDSLIDLREFLISGKYVSIDELISHIKSSISGYTALDSIDILPREYRTENFLLDILAKLEENGGIISSDRLDVKGLLKKLGFKFEEFYLREISLTEVYSFLLKFFPNSDIHHVKLLSCLSEGYPQAINFLIGKGKPDEIFKEVDGQISINWRLICDLNYVFQVYYELRNVKREFILYKLLSYISKAVRARELREINPGVPTYISRLFNIGIIDRLLSGKTAIYYIRDPILRLHILLSETTAPYIPLSYINQYVGLQFLIKLFLLKSQGYELIDSSGQKLKIEDIRSVEVVNDRVIRLIGRNRISVYIYWDEASIKMDEVLSDDSEMKIIMILSEASPRTLRRVKSYGIYIIDRSSLPILTTLIGFNRNILS